MSRYAMVALIAILLPFPGRAFAQTGTVTGKVHDQKSGEELIGANVLLVGTTLGAVVDVEGKYTIRNVPAGTYQLRVSYIGYTSKVIEGVIVKAGETVQYDVSLGEEVEEAKEEVVVSAQRVLSTEAAVLSERQKAATIGDAVSAEQIKRSPDATSGDALKRVTGVSIVDNKFVFVRGVTDRYNSTSLDGVSVTSTDTDVDRKSFSFDLVPANLLENTVVVKTATPDLPGDFSGGLVQVNTLDFPTQRTGRVQAGLGWDVDTTTRPKRYSAGGGHDWLGIDDGSRALPEPPVQGNALASVLPNDWALTDGKAPVNSVVNASYGDRFALGSDEVGYVGAISYRNGYLTSNFEQRPSYQGVPLFSFEGTRYQRFVLWGGLLNLNYKLRGLHKFSFKNNFNQSAEEKINLSSGLPASGEFQNKQTTEWDQRSFYLGQFGGEHKIPSLHGLLGEWRVHYSRSKAEEPNRKEVEYELRPGGSALKNNYRTWADLDEEATGGGADFTLPFGGTKLKTGGLLDRRTRTYGIDAYSSDPSRLAPENYGYLVQPIQTIFDPSHYGAGKFQFIPITTFTGAYDGEHKLGAAYGMVDRPQTLGGQNLRLAGGVRVEDSDIEVRSKPESGSTNLTVAKVVNTDWLPSVNLTWIATEEANLRLAYGRSVNRPEFRELADVLYYDFDNEQNVQGNPNLRRALIDNYDVRLEFFPQVGEVLAGSFFYKQLEDAIEEQLIPSPERFVRTWFNSPEGKNYGFELEARKGLGSFGSAFAPFSVTGNYTRIWSEIEYTDSRTDPSGNPVITQQTRVMQGQSPWSVNVSLLYSEPRTRTSVNVLYGKVGRRLDAVGDTRDEDVYEESRDLLEIALTQGFLSRWEGKLSVRNLFGEDEVYTTGPERSTWARYERAPIWSLQFALGL